MEPHIVAHTAGPGFLLPSSPTGSETGRQQQAQVNSLTLSLGLGGWWPIGWLALNRSDNTLNPRQTMCRPSLVRPKNDRPAGEEGLCYLVGGFIVHLLWSLIHTRYPATKMWCHCTWADINAFRPWIGSMDAAMNVSLKFYGYNFY